MKKTLPSFTIEAAVCYRVAVLVLALASLVMASVLPETSPETFNLDDPQQRQAFVEMLKEQRKPGIEGAAEYLRRTGLPKRWENDKGVFELMAIENGQHIVYMTLNSNSAISIAADIVRDDPYYWITGTGITAGVWDAGIARPTHQELTGRIVAKDGASVDWHATAVTGTLAAAGIDASATGMAPDVNIDGYNWTNDTSEMANAGMSSPGQAGKLQVSNHSYGIICGWSKSGTTWSWYGNPSFRESALFGQYNYLARDFDDICFKAPYYLPILGAGNDRGDTTRPTEGGTYYINGSTAAVFYADTGPYADNYKDGGFDTLMPGSCAKNVLTLGAVNDAVTGGVRDLSKATMSTLSAWGPTDDGRVKPDLVTNGVSVYTCNSSSDTAYGTWTGTSLAAPAAAGAAVQLLDLYGLLFPSKYMRSSTLKALMIHTADDLGNPGPDYKFGWGLLNVETAAEKLLLHKRNPTLRNITEDYLKKGKPPSQDIRNRDYTFVWDGASPIRATLCWTDAAGLAENTNTLNSTAIKLVRNLGIVITAPGGTQYYPFVLDPANPNASATTGTNTRDNVKQVLIAAPPQQGTYNIRISFDSGTNIQQQFYSVILSGQAQPAVYDIDGDGHIGLGDLLVLATHWLTEGPTGDIYPAVGDGWVDLSDYSFLASKWLEH